MARLKYYGCAWVFPEDGSKNYFNGRLMHNRILEFDREGIIELEDGCNFVVLKNDT